MSADLSTFLADLGAYLAANGCGTLGSTLFLAQFPPGLSPATCASVLTETQGLPSNDPAGLAFPRVQVVTRCSDYATARLRAHLIHSVIHNLQAMMIGPLGCNAKALQTPFSIGLDERSAWRIACNYQFDAG